MKREASIDKRPQDILTLPFVKYVKHRTVFLQPKKKGTQCVSHFENCTNLQNRCLFDNF